MSTFEIIPVIDILNSRAVHAVKGERSKYKPLNSYLLDSVNFPNVIETLMEEFNFSTYYMADLDSIIDNVPNTLLLTDFMDKTNKVTILLDQGIETIEDLDRVSSISNIKVILGLETIEGFDIISAAINRLGQENVLISIDMYKGNLFSKNKKISTYKPIEIISDLEQLGVSNIILLDLYRVGQKMGGIPSHYKRIRNKFKGTIIVGGGVKNIADVSLYYEHNFTGVLIGTALYDGTIKKRDIISFFNEIN